MTIDKTDIFALTDVWNEGATEFNAFDLDITNTASAAGSRAMRVRIDGADLFAFEKDSLPYRARAGGNIGDGRQHLFMDVSAWSAANGGASVDAANNFHVADSGELRVEFESLDDLCAVYAESGTGFDSFFAVQEGATTHWSWGQDQSDSNNFVVNTGFGVGAGVQALRIRKSTSRVSFQQGIFAGTSGMRFFGKLDTATTNLHLPIAQHVQWRMEENGANDAVLQIASDDGGTIATGIILSMAPATGDNRHWAIQGHGVTHGYEFSIGFYQSTATGQNILASDDDVFTISTGGLVGIGQGGNVAKSGKLHIDQSNTAGAIPCLYLEQTDVDEELITFDCTIGTGNGIEAVGAKTLTTTHFVKVNIVGVGDRYMPAGTIA